MKFIVNNYKAIFHLIGIAITFGIFLLTGLGDEMKNPLFCILVLGTAYFASNFGLRKSGLDEEFERLKNKAQKKEIINLLF